MSLPRKIRVVHVIGTGILVLFVSGYWAYVELVHPLPYYADRFDPEMPYMTASLSIFKGQPYAYIDHPGTPMEILGTILMAAMRPFIPKGSLSLPEYLLQNPDVFLRPARGLLALGSLVCLVVLSHWSVEVRRWGDIPVALGAACAFFVSFPQMAFDTVAFWSHNSLTFPAGTLFLLALMQRLRSGNELQQWEIWLVGGISGVLVASQLYFASWVIGAMVALAVYFRLRGMAVPQILWRTGALGVAAFLGFFAATQAIIHRYREFAWWVTTLVTHQGRYGRGPLGFISGPQLLESLRILWEQAPLPLTVMALCLVLLVASMLMRMPTNRKTEGWWAMSLGVAVQAIVTFVMIGKHPGAVYLLALAAMVPIMLALSLQVMVWAAGSWRVFAITLGLVVLTGLPAGLLAAARFHDEKLLDTRESETEVQRIRTVALAHAGGGVEDPIVVWGYRMPSKCYALRFGDLYTEGVFADEINAMCPNDWAYNFFDNSVSSPKGVVPLAMSAPWHILIATAARLPENANELGEVTYSADGSIAFILASGSPK